MRLRQKKHEEIDNNAIEYWNKIMYNSSSLWQHHGNKKSDSLNLPDNVSTTDILCEITHTNLFKIDFTETSGNNEQGRKVVALQRLFFFADCILAAFFLGSTNQIRLNEKAC